MKTIFWMTAVLTVTLAFVGGCDPANKTSTADSGRSKDSGTQTAASQTSDAKETNDGWWCVEHGVPEGICAQCNSKVAADFKKKGDWCKEHDRPESQCFICHPNLEARFAAQYQAKYGKKAPKPAE